MSRSIGASSMQTSEMASPSTPGSAGATDAMQVVGGHHRQLVVDDVRQLLDVEAARRDLGRDQQRDPSRLEVVQRSHALRLRLVAVDRGGGDAVLPQLLGELVGAVLGAGEDECLVDGVGAHQVR